MAFQCNLAVKQTFNSNSAKQGRNTSKEKQSKIINQDYRSKNILSYLSKPLVRYIHLEYQILFTAIPIIFPPMSAEDNPPKVS